MRLLVCGTREWSGAWEQIAIHLPDEDDLTIIHGACSRVRRGVQVSVDMIVDFVARGLGHRVEKYPVNRHLDGPWPAAGPHRNARMMAAKPERGLAFGPAWKRYKGPDKKLYKSLIGDPVVWINTGTGDMVRRMLDARLPVRWIETPEAPAVDLVTMPEPPR